MKRDFSQPLVTFTGQPMVLSPERQAADGAIIPAEVATLDAVAIEALGSPLLRYGQPVSVSGTEAVKVFDLALRLRAGGEIEISADELRIISERIAAHFPAPIVSGQAIKMLEN